MMEPPRIILNGNKAKSDSLYYEKVRINSASRARLYTPCFFASFPLTGHSAKTACWGQFPNPFGAHPSGAAARPADA